MLFGRVFIDGTCNLSIIHRSHNQLFVWYFINLEIIATKHSRLSFTFLTIDAYTFLFNCRCVWLVALLPAVENVLKATNVALIKKRKRESPVAAAVTQSCLRRQPSRWAAASCLTRTHAISHRSSIFNPRRELISVASLKFKMAYVLVPTHSCTHCVSRSRLLTRWRWYFTSWVAGSSAHRGYEPRNR